MQDPFGEIAIDPDPKRLGAVDGEIEMALGRELPDRLDHGLCGGRGVGDAARACLGTRRREQRVDDARDLVGIRENHRQCPPVFLGLPWPPEGELGLRRHPRERRAQLVRQLRREAPLVTQARSDAIEQAVECEGEPRELVVGLAAREAPIEIVLAPGAGQRRHLGDRLQRGAQQPDGCAPRDEQQRRGEHE